MGMRLVDLLDLLRERCNKDSTITANFDDYLKKNISLACKRHANMHSWKDLIESTNFATVSGTNEYFLPSVNNFKSLINAWHKGYSKYDPITIINPNAFYQSGLSSDITQDYPDGIFASQNAGAYAQPSSATVLGIQSDNSADTSVSVTINGIVGGYFDIETISTNSSDGTTLVNGTKLFTKIFSISKDKSTTGKITIKADTTTVAILMAGSAAMESKYYSFIVYPTPSTSANTIYFRYKKKQYSLINDNDVSLLSDDHDNAILLLAEFYILRETKTFEAYKTELKELKNDNDVALSNSDTVVAGLSKFSENPAASIGGKYVFPFSV